MFKEYKNKSSIYKRYSRYLQGGTTEVKQKKLGWWERRTDFLTPAPDDIIIYALPKVYEGKPGLLTYDIYGREDLEWIVLQYNNIVDIVEEFVAGARINLPSKRRVFFDIAIKTITYNVES